MQAQGVLVRRIRSDRANLGCYGAGRSLPEPLYSHTLLPGLFDAGLKLRHAIVSQYFIRVQVDDKSPLPAPKTQLAFRRRAGSCNRRNSEWRECYPTRVLLLIIRDRLRCKLG